MRVKDLCEGCLGRCGARAESTGGSWELVEVLWSRPSSLTVIDRTAKILVQRGISRDIELVRLEVDCEPCASKSSATISNNSKERMLAIGDAIGSRHGFKAIFANLSGELLLSVGPGTPLATGRTQEELESNVKAAARTLLQDKRREITAIEDLCSVLRGALALSGWRNV